MSAQVGQITNTRGGLGGEYRRQIVLNDEQIKALPETVPLLVPAISGKIIMPALMVFKLDPWFADYDNISNANWLADWPSGAFYAASGTGAKVTDTLSNGAATIDVFEQDFPEDDVGPFLVSDLANMSLGLFTDNFGDGPFDLGDPRNLLTVTIFYNLF